MAGPTLTLPTPGGSLDTWGTTLNTAVNQVNDYDGFKRKTVDEPITSATALQDDNDLFVSVVASAVYLVQWDFKIDGATAGDFKYAWTGPASATMTWSSEGHDVADTTNVAPRIQDAAAIGTNITHGTLGTGVPSHVRGNGILVVAGTAGTFQLQWAQGTSSGTASKALTGSWLMVRQVV